MRKSLSAVLTFIITTSTFLGAIQTPLTFASTFDCSTVTGISQTECSALLAIYDATGGPTWIDATNWDDALQTDACTWYGVVCLGGHVDQLSLSGNNLSGVLPPEIGDLTFTTYLDLSINALTGMDTNIGSMSSLTQLDVSDNQITSVPAGIGSLSSLTQLNLGINLISSVPPEIGDLSSLNSLILSGNSITVLPNAIGNLTNLVTFQILANQLTTLPTTINSLTSLSILSLDDNILVYFPDEMGQMNWLDDIDMSGNLFHDLQSALPAGLTSVVNGGFDNNCLVRGTLNAGVETWFDSFFGAWENLNPSCEFIQPSVTVEQDVSQIDPTTISSIVFTATFDESIIEATFTCADVVVTNGICSSIVPAGGNVYTINVTASAAGVVTASINNATLLDSQGNDNNTSTSTDNSVTYDIPAVVTSSVGGGVIIPMSPVQYEPRAPLESLESAPESSPIDQTCRTDINDLLNGLSSISRADVTSLALRMTCLRPVRQKSELHFSDVKSGAQYRDDLMEALGEQIITPKRSIFEPDRIPSRAETFAIILAAAGLYDRSAWLDDWYYEVYNVARVNGITVREWSDFEPSAPITRDELRLIVERVLGVL